EHCDVVVGLTIKFKSCTDRRSLRRRARFREGRLVSNQMERRHVAEGCPAYDRVANCWLRLRRGLHVFVAYRSASFHAAICSFAIWKTADLQRGLDGAQPRHKRCTENDGHHHSGAVYRNKGGQLRSLAALARFSENAIVRT